MIKRGLFILIALALITTSVCAETDAPVITYTPSDSTLSVNDTIINMTTTDASDHYSFLDFGNTLKLWLRMDNLNSTGDPTDSSTFSNNATRFGGIINLTHGKFGNGTLFNGTNEYLEIPSSESLNSSMSELTLTFWVKPLSFNNVMASIIEKGALNNSNRNYTDAEFDYTIAANSATTGLGTGTKIADINSDGINDLIVGAYKDKIVTTAFGSIRIYYGAEETYGSLTFTESNLTIYSPSASYESGRSVAIGDLNNDGSPDLIAGARTGGLGAPFNPRGRVYVQFTPFPESISDFSDPNITFDGSAANDHLGIAVAAGDLNNDGKDDLVMGAHDAEGIGGSASGAGEVYIFYGELSDNDTAISVDTYNSSFFGEAASNQAGSALGIGDINNDGQNDLLIGARAAATGGKVYGFFGPLANSGDINVSTANVTFTTSVASGQYGESVSVGDINDDGYNDIAIGADNESSGKVYIYYGSFSQGDVLTDIDANITINSTQSTAEFGISNDIGDYNMDGRDDLIVGSRTAGNGGEAELIYGPLQHTNEISIGINNNGSVSVLYTNSSGVNKGAKSNAIETDEYSFIAVRINGTHTTIFNDGTTTIDSETNLLSLANNNLRIGAMEDSSGKNLNGSLDEILIFNRSLTDTEILALYNASATQYSRNFTNLAEGTQTFLGYAVDIFGNLASSTLSLLIDVDGSESISTQDNTNNLDSSSSGGIPAYRPTQYNLQQGYTRTVVRGSTMTFDHNNEQHEIKLRSIQNRKALLRISSTPQEKEMAENEIWKVDLDNDGYYDLSVETLKITSLTARITVRTIHEEIKKTPGQKTDQFEGEDLPGLPAPEETAKIENRFVILIIALIIVIAVIAYFLIRKHNNPWK